MSEFHSSGLKTNTTAMISDNSIFLRRSTHCAAIVFLHVLLLVPITGIIIEIAKSIDYIYAFPLSLFLTIGSTLLAHFLWKLVLVSRITMADDALLVHRFGKQIIIPWTEIKSIYKQKETSGGITKEALFISLKNDQTKIIELNGWGETDEELSDFLNTLLNSNKVHN